MKRWRWWWEAVPYVKRMFGATYWHEYRKK
jgi:hypothetical protein